MAPLWFAAFLVALSLPGITLASTSCTTGSCPAKIHCNCASNVGTYVVPSDNSGATYDKTLPFKLAGSYARSKCCSYCGNDDSTANRTALLNKMGSQGCNFWLHVPSSSQSNCDSTDPCGSCYLYPVGTSPQCSATETRCMTSGRPCSAITGDPHFVGALGTRFEFNGLPDKTFCLLTDETLELNMMMRGYLDTRTVGASVLKDGKAIRTWITQLGLLWKTTDGKVSKLRLSARDGGQVHRGAGFLSGIELDGKTVPLLKVGGSLTFGEMSLEFTGLNKVGPFDVDEYELRVGKDFLMNFNLRVAHPLLQTPDDSHVHFNMEFPEVKHSASVHGVLGQTYREGREKRAMDYGAVVNALHHPVAADGATGAGFLDGTPADYETSDLMAADCKFTVFNGLTLPETVDKQVKSS